MKTYIINLLLLPTVIAVLGLMPVGRVTAQTFTTLHNFYVTDGIDLQAGLILSGNTLYGTASRGGSSGRGTVFAVNTSGNGFTNLHSFPNTTNDYFNSDGAYPTAELVLSGNTLYGTASLGGQFGSGTVFAINTDGTGFKVLHEFTGSDGCGPTAGLILSGNTLYGTASDCGSGSEQSRGSVFKLNTNGTGFTVLHSFPEASGTLSTNSDGAYPTAGLILSGNTLYGTAGGGGSGGGGTVFKLNTNGTDFTILHSFTAVSGPNRTNSDGTGPSAELFLSGNTLYGTAIEGGSSGNGTVFAVNTDGTGFTTLHSFTTASGSYPYLTNSDGVYPTAGLILAGNTLYGTASIGGSSGFGTVFAVDTNGTGFTNLHSFTDGSEGRWPNAGLILSGNTLYGTTSSGGSVIGTVFSLSLRAASGPQLTIIPSGANVILTWPTNAAGFALQSTTNLVSLAVWGTVSPGPVVVNGQNAVTNPVSGAQQFYRLSQ